MMICGRWLLPVGFGLVCVALGSCASRPPQRVLIDLPRAMRSTEMPGYVVGQHDEGPLTVSSCQVPGLLDLKVSVPSSGGTPIIITGQFLQPIEGRARAMQALGTGDGYTVVTRAPGRVVHSGGDFAELSLFRRPGAPDAFTGVWAATAAGVAAME